MTRIDAAADPDARSAAAPAAPIGVAAGAIRTLEGVPAALYELFFRIGLAFVFGFSGRTKIANWDRTIKLFHDIYQVPLLSPETAAYLSTGIELTVPFLLVLGLGTRVAAAAMLCMTLVIQLFVLPGSYPVHALWLGPILYLLLRGPGVLSLDHLVRRRFMGDR